MIGRSNRFHGRASIQRLYKAGDTVRANMLSLRYAPNPKRQEYRLAVVVSRKVSKSAVVRNRIRRRIYDCVRILSSSFTGVYDLAFIIYDEKIATLSPAELAAEVERLCKKAKLTPSVTPARRDIVEHNNKRDKMRDES